MTERSSIYFFYNNVVVIVELYKQTLGKQGKDKSLKIYLKVNGCTNKEMIKNHHFK